MRIKLIIITAGLAFILATALFVLSVSSCGLGLNPTVPSDKITLNQVGPYKYTDGHLIWEYCSHPESEPSRSLCGICHYIY